ncbi:hypothetical protein T459_24163 [Capsicum annuum]|uniref:NB-ARC domain-containing protein n=1 Tax=Capsicum annuum TaxID=4072 RepID=A0A2G2YUD3_CAPAN|nr:hypothetical protein T459_24163 [Capsicum annuum]
MPMYQIMLIMVTGLMRLWKKVASIAGDVLYVIQNLLPGSIDKDETSDTGDNSIRSLEKPKDLKALVKSYYKSLKFIPSQFYRTSGGLRFLDSLLSKLNERRSCHLYHPFSEMSQRVHHEHEILKDFWRRTIHLAYEAEVAIDSILLLFLSIMCFDVALKPYYVEEPSKHLPSQHSNPVGDDDEIVGFYIATEKVIWHLTRETRYNQRDLLQKIFSQVTGSMDKGEKDDILTDKLRENLIGKRYHIVLDNMWDGIEWDNLRLFFPDGGKHCAENGLFFSYKMKMLLPQGWYEQGIFSTFLSGNKIPSWFTKLVVRSILKENLFEHYYVQTAGSEGGVEEEEDDDDSILDYDNDDEDEEATLVEIEKLFGDLGERNGIMLQQCVNIDELKKFVIFEGEKKLM